MGGRMCTRKDVAEHAGVSVTTVSNVLNHSKEARPEIVERVQKGCKGTQLPSQSDRQGPENE